MKTALLYSGGLDSTTLLHMKRDMLSLCIYIKYGSNHSRQELSCARAMCQQENIPLLVLETNCYDNSSSALCTNNIRPGCVGPNMLANIVEFRNPVLISMAFPTCIAMGIDTLFVGFHTEDHSVFLDCRKEFIDSFNNMAEVCGYSTRVVAPFLAWSKEEIKQFSIMYNIPDTATWSCYVGGDTPCGECGACLCRNKEE